MTVIPLRPIIKQPSPEQRLRRRVFACLDSQICAFGCSLTIEGIARSVHPSQRRELYRLVPVLRGKSAVETLTTLLLQGPPWWRIEAPVWQAMAAQGEYAAGPHYARNGRGNAAALAYSISCD